MKGALAEYRNQLGPIGSIITGYWNLHETGAGARASQRGVFPLSAIIGTPTTQAGPKAGSDIALKLTGASAIGNITNEPLLAASATGGYCSFGWFYPTVTASTQTVLACWDGGVSTTLNYLLDFTGTVITGVAGGASYNTATGVVPSLNLWHFFMMWLDPATNKFNLQLDNGVVTSSPAGVVPAVSSEPFFLGAFNTPANFFTGGISRVGWIQGNILTSTQRTSLYNGGPSGALDWSDIVAMGL